MVIENLYKLSQGREMKYLKHYNQQYSNLCAIYGDLMLKKRQIDDELKQILSKINTLQQSQQTLATIEQELTKESQNEQNESNSNIPNKL